MPELKIANFLGRNEHCHVAAPVLAQLKPAATHSHDFLEIFWCDRGHGGHWINGDRRELAPGVLVFVRADDEHAFTGSAEMPLRIVNIAFMRETWKFLRDRYGGEERDLFSPGDAETRERRLSPAQMAELARHAAELRGGARSREAIERFLLNLTQLVRQIDTAQPTAELPAWLESGDTRDFIAGAFCCRHDGVSGSRGEEPGARRAGRPAVSRHDADGAGQRSENDPRRRAINDDSG